MDSSTHCTWEVRYLTPTGTIVTYEVTAPADAGPHTIAAQAADHHARHHNTRIDNTTPALRFLGYAQDASFDGQEVLAIQLHWTVVGADWDGASGYTPLTVFPGLLTPARAFIEDGLWANIAHIKAPTPEDAKRLASIEDDNPTTLRRTIPPSLFTIRSVDAAA